MEFLVRAHAERPKRALLTAFRHSGKSTVVGIFAAWLLKTKPESRLLVLSAEQTLAGRMAAHIKHVLEHHPECKDLIPDGKKEWAAHKFTVARAVGIREPSLACQGVRGNITGMRADLIICDDVEVPNTANTAPKREDLRTRLRELDFILSPEGCIVYIGTPHAEDTIYKTMKNED
jgi:hypothetical protein